MPTTVEVLRRFGLTDYGARAYSALASSPPLTGEEVSRRTSIPRSRVYDVLRGLAREGWVEVEGGRPTRFRARSVEETLTRLREAVDRDLEALEELKDEVPAGVVRPEVAVFYGWEHIEPRLRGLVVRSRQDILMVIGFLHAPGLRALLDALAEARAPARLTVGLEGATREEHHVIRRLNTLTEVRCVTAPMKVWGCLFDRSTMLLIFPSLRGRVMDPESMVGIQVTYPELGQRAAEIAGMFYRQARPLSPGDGGSRGRRRPGRGPR